jgi:hypothetical protein
MGAVGSYLRHIETSADRDDFNKSLRGLGPEQPSAEAIKQAHEEALRADQANLDTLETQANADAFIVAHPELKDTVANARLLLNQARTMFGDNGPITVDQWDAAYQHLRTKTDFLDLDAKKLAEQQREASHQRYVEQKATEAARIFNLPEAALEAMSLEDIRRLDAQERQREMQRRGEEGGF